MLFRKPHSCKEIYASNFIPFLYSEFDWDMFGMLNYALILNYCNFPSVQGLNDLADLDLVRMTSFPHHRCLMANRNMQPELQGFKLPQ